MENLIDRKKLKECMDKYSDFPPNLALRVYTSRLMGAERDLVLHGGGNTSVKIIGEDLVGDQCSILFVKGSGRDLATIDPGGFTGLRLDELRKHATLGFLSDEDLDNLLRVNRISWQSPDPSVETFLHAFLPHKFIDHTHADSILALTNQKNGAGILKEMLGSQTEVISYIRSGFPMARAVLEIYERNPDVDSIIIMNHGIFTFSEDAEKSYARMIEVVGLAEKYIEEQPNAGTLTRRIVDTSPAGSWNSSMARCVQAIRGSCAYEVSGDSLRRFLVETRNRPELVDASLAAEAESICASGVLTPDHAIRTKNKTVYIETVPENDEELKNTINQAVEVFKKDYQKYFQTQAGEKGLDCEMLDPFPRLFLIAGLGLAALGLTRKEALIAADIAEHTVLAKRGVWSFGEYSPISDTHIFDMEYWPLQQRKLGSARMPLLQGQVAVVTGGGGAIGYGIAERLLDEGAVVVLSDIDESALERVRSILGEKYDKHRIKSMVFDVTDITAIERAFEKISCKFGGIDLVVPNAGIAHVARIEDLEPEKFDQVVSVNLKGTFTVIKASVPVFRRQGTGGNIVVISSKNVFAPGAAFGAYSAAKAGAHQLSKVAALELAEIGVRVNMINPDAVFGDGEVSSKLWDLIGPDRMKSRGLDADGLKNYYRERSLLKVPVLARHVGNAVVFFASNQTPTTGAALPVDAGNVTAFPR